MDKLLLPKYRFKCLLDVTPEDLKKMGAKAVALDIDNTMAPDGTFRFLDGLKDWILSIYGAGIPIMIVSNGSFLRVAPIAKMFQLPYICHSHKPYGTGLTRAAKIMGVKIEELAMLGDQIFSDVKAANVCGAIAVRIDPIPAKSLYPRYYAKKAEREKPIIEAFEKLHGYGVYDD